jgi:hypothetical protein
MQIAKRYSPSPLTHRTPEAESAVWVMIVLLLGIAAFALFSLYDKIGG